MARVSRKAQLALIDRSCLHRLDREHRIALLIDRGKAQCPVVVSVSGQAHAQGTGATPNSRTPEKEKGTSTSAGLIGVQQCGVQGGVRQCWMDAEGLCFACALRVQRDFGE